MVTVEKFREYARCDEDEDVSVYLNAAKKKAKSAGINERKNDARYDLFIYALAALWFDNRSFDYDGEAVQKMINAFVLELR